MDMSEENLSIRVPMPQGRDLSRPAGLGGLINTELVTTITKTLFSSGSVTRTIAEGGNTSLDASPGSPQTVANPSGITTNTVTSDYSTRSAISTAKGGNFTLNGNSVALTSARHAATITGATLGSAAALGLIGVFLWFCCYKNRSRRDRLKQTVKLQNLASLAMRKRKLKGSDTTLFESQGQQENEEQKLMDETRAIMLKRKSALKALEGGNESQANLLGMAAHPGMSSTPSLNTSAYQQAAPPPMSRPPSTIFTQSARPSAIGLAVTNNPKLPVTPYSSSSQLQRWPQPVEMPAPSLYSSTTAAVQPCSTSSAQSTISIPRKQPQMKPAPLITSLRMGKPERSSPLSPRAMFNKVSGAVKKLSPGGSRRGDLASDGRGGFETLLGEDGKLKTNEYTHSGDRAGGGAKVKAAKWI